MQYKKKNLNSECIERDYKEARRAARSEARIECKDFQYNILPESLAYDPKVFWSYVREVRGGRSRVDPLKSYSGEILSDPKSKANALNKYYEKCFIKANNNLINFPKRATSEGRNPIIF